MKMLARRAFPPLVHQMSFWLARPLGSLFLQPDCWNGIPGSELFLILRALIEAKVLVPAGRDEAGCSREKTPWDSWGAARSFYLETRSTSETSYLTNGEVESQLSLQMKLERQPSAYKDYWVHPFFALPNPTQGDRNSSEFLDVVLKRRTARSFGPDPLSAEVLSDLLFYTWGAQSAEGNPRGDVFLKKTSPSGGSLHPVEVYPVLLNVAGFDSGVYHYSVRRHGLELLAREDPMEWVRAACGGQEWVADCAALFVSTAVLRRPAWKYHFGRAFRVALQDSGHLSGMFNLVASWLGLASFTTGALRDELFEDKLGLIHLEEPVLLVNGVGARASDVVRPERPRKEAAQACR